MSDIYPNLGKYQVLEEIGRGGMGAVYRGHDPFLNRTVAIKLLAPHLVWEKDFIERFMREARAVAQLDHPNIIHIYDVGQDGANYYFVMAYLPGQSLKQVIKQKGHLAPTETLAILRQLADALDYAHSKGLVHRDVKPVNVMFNERGQAILTDFGIVKAAEESRLTGTGASIGTPHYMAPEQIEGQDIDARTDQYALGIMAFEMLAGRVPFDAQTTSAIFYKHVNEPPPSALALCPSLPPTIQAVLNRVLAKSPAQRFSSCGEFVSALEQILGQTTQAAQQTSTAQPATRSTQQAAIAPAAPKRGLPIWILIIGLLAVLACAVGISVAGIGWLMQQGGEINRQPTLTTEAISSHPTPTAADTAPPTADTATPQPTLSAPANQAIQVKPLAVYENAASHFAWSVDGKMIFIAAYNLHRYDAANLKDGGDIQTGSVSKIVISSDGKMAALVAYDGVRLWDTNTWTELRALAGSQDTNSAAFSPDGKWLATAIGSAIKLWNTSNGQEARTIPVGSRVTTIAFSPDGNTIASGGYGDIQFWDPESGKEMLNLKAQPSIQTLAFSPVLSGGNQLLATGSSDKTIQIWDVTNKHALHRLDGHTEQVTCVAFSPDGRFLASTSWDLTVKLWDVASGTKLDSLTGHTSWVQWAAFSPDGNTLATGSNDQMRLWSLRTGSIQPEPTPTLIPPIPTATRVPQSFKAISASNAGQIAPVHLIEGNSVKQVVWSPDGKQLALATYGIYLYDSSSLEQIQKIDTQWVDSLVFSPDGQMIASASYQGVMLWDTRSGGQVHELGGSKDTKSIAFSPNGTLLATAAGSAVKLWDTRSGQEMRTIPVGSQMNAVTFSPDGQRIASVGLNEIILWDTNSGNRALALGGHSNWVNSVAFSADGKTLATGSTDKTVKLWNVATGRLLHTLEGHTDQVTGIAFSPDGRLLASGSWDLTVRLWDVSSGQEIRSLTAHTERVNSVAFSPDGAFITSGSDDQTVRLWGIK